MHIWYELRAECGTLDRAERLVSDLHRMAANLPFDRVTELQPVESRARGVDGLFAANSIDLPHPTDGRRSRMLSFDPLEGVGFVVFPGQRCESASFGLARYPRFIDDEETGESQATGFGNEFYWHWGCKTQYAFRLGREHFLRCHLTLIELLDRANEMGIVARVTDAGGYWESRSIEDLLRIRQEHDEMVAAVVGPIADALANVDGQIIAPVMEDPRFEYLEAEGRRKLGERRVEEGP
jgi:hypothetical protein